MVNPRQTRIVSGEHVLVLAGPTLQLEFRPPEYNYPDAPPETSPTRLFDHARPECGSVSLELAAEFLQQLAVLDEIAARMVAGR